MKKYGAASFSALILSIFVFASCAPGTSSAEQSTQSLQSEAVSFEETSSQTESDVPIVEPTDFFTEHGQPFLPQTGSLPADCGATDTPYLYTLPLELPQAGGFSAQANGDSLWLFYWDTENRCALCSLQTGEFVCGISLPKYGAWGMAEGGGLWVAEFPDLRVTFFDSKGESRTVFEETERNTDSSVPQYAELGKDGRTLLVGYGEGAPLALYDLESGVRTVLTVPDGLSFWGATALENGFLLNCSDGGVLILNVSDGTSERFYPDGMIGRLYGGLCGWVEDHCLLLGTWEEDAPYFRMELQDGEALADCAFGCAVTQSYQEDPTVRFYDLRGSVLLEELVFGEATDAVTVCMTDGGAVLLFAFTEDGTEPYLYDLPDAVSHGGTPVETLLYTEAELIASTARIAAELEETAGIDLLYGSEGNDFVLPDYIGAAETDSYAVYRTVCTVRDLLDRFPAGMLREAYEGMYKGIRLYLCGALYGLNSDSLSTAGGLTTVIDGWIVVAVDVHNNPVYDIPHEFSHVFDKRIERVCAEGGTDWLSVWETFTPFADAYTYTYQDYYGNTAYTAWMEEDSGDVWFTDGYARTFPTEDRARIFEHLFNLQTSDASEELLGFAHLREKAALYSEILRQCFPSCAQAETLYWETQG